MCGLVGMAGNLLQKHEDAYKEMLVFDSVRGHHSTGTAFINSGGGINIQKSIGSPFNLFHRTEFKSAFLSKNKVLIGHNRYATVGEVNEENAHPFQYNAIVGAHNGTLTNKYILENANNFKVDSQALFNHIDKNGVDSAIKNLGGAWAITYWNAADNTLNFLRNKERPLFYAFTKDKQVLLWASEEWMILVACLRSNIEIESIIPVDENILYTIPLLKDNKLGAVQRRECASFWKPYEYPQQQQWQGYQNWKHYKQEESKEKKHSSNVTRILSNTNNPLVGARGRVVKVIGEGTEVSGAKYLILLDEEYTDDYIRLYIHARDDSREYFGEELIVDLHDKMFLNTNTNVPYLKAVYSTHIIIDDTNEDGKPKIVDHNNQQISKEDFYKTYGHTCNFCDSDVDPEEGGYKVNASKALLCKTCAADVEISHFIN